MPGRINKTETLHVILLSAAAIASTAVNLVISPSPFLAAYPLAGTIACFALSRLGDYDRHLLCDYIPTGEAAVGAIALVTALIFIGSSPVILMPAVFLVLLASGLFQEGLVAPRLKEIAASGAAAQAILCLIMAYLLAVPSGAGARIPWNVLTGYFSAAPGNPLLPAAAMVVSLLTLCLVLLFSSELKLHSQGPFFSADSGLPRRLIAAARVTARAVLTSIMVLFSGFLCGPGIGIRGLRSNTLRDLVVLLYLVCFAQIALLVSRYAGPWYAAALSFIISYALFFLNQRKRTHSYDRYQQA
jgi:hypothetical protein